MIKYLYPLAKRLFPQKFYRNIVAANIDVEFYKIQTGLNIDNSKILAQHYLDTGHLKKIDPTDYFSTEKYLQRNPDVKKSPLNPFVHYLIFGRAELRDTGVHIKKIKTLSQEEIINSLNVVDSVKALKPHFDYKLYQKQSEKKLLHTEAAILHYLNEGEKEGLLPHPDFDPVFYLKDNPDLINAEFCLYLHYIIHGRTEGRHGNGHHTKHYSSIAEVIRPEFDTAYYQSQSPNYVRFSADPVINYLQDGYARGLNPNRDFDSRFYRITNSDLDGVGMNGFYHYIKYGRQERRSPQSYFSNTDNFKPLISVIIPNYNHADYLKQRLQTVAEQTYQNIEILILDDCSTDNSREVIKNIVENYKDKNIQILFNKKNSGGVFNQWQKGIENASGDYIWICESDDFCELDFLEHLVPHFADRSVNIAFGKIDFCDKSGSFMAGMDGFRQQSEIGIWEETVKRPAKTWFYNGFGVNNVIANVGGCVFKKTELAPKIWRQAKTYKIAGDWFLYLHIAGGGQIVFEPKSATYFRQHDRNTSATNFNKLYFYEELNKVSNEIDEYWMRPADTKEKFLSSIKQSFKHLKMSERGYEFDKIFTTKNTLKENKRPHILIGFLGFISGGGEVFAINLANALYDLGYTVSMIAVEMHDINTNMSEKLRKGIAVYSVSNLAEMGRDTFFEAAGIDLVHSNVVGVDSLLFEMDKSKPVEVPYVVTLHGSYDGLNIKDPAVLNLLNLCYDNVTYWVNTAGKNLKVLKNTGFTPQHLEHIQNGMPANIEPFGKTRADLGIDEKAFIFTFVARGVKGKGWNIAIKAFQRLQKKITDHDIHLILVGDGEVAEKAIQKIRKKDKITYLGYQSEINGIYRMSDCAIVPTRFVGESAPLCIIQALQENIPIIAADHGDIKTMLTLEKKHAGHLIDYDENDTRFMNAFANAMGKMCVNKRYRNKFIKNIADIRKQFEMPRMISKYENVYAKAQNIFQLSKEEHTPSLSEDV